MKYFEIILLLFISCSSSQKIEFDPVEPTTKFGCGNAGVNFFQCLKRESLRWEKIESAQGVFFVESEDREGDFLISKGKLCFSEYFCRPYSQKTYSQSIWSKAKEYGLLILIGSLMGAGATNK